jgi:hypothetical protein
MELQRPGLRWQCQGERHREAHARLPLRVEALLGDSRLRQQVLVASGKSGDGSPEAREKAREVLPNEVARVARKLDPSAPVVLDYTDALAPQVSGPGGQLAMDHGTGVSMDITTRPR